MVIKKYNHIFVLLCFLALVLVLTLQGRNFLVEASAIEIGVTIVFSLAVLYDCCTWIVKKVRSEVSEPLSVEMKVTYILEVSLLCMLAYNIL